MRFSVTFSSCEQPSVPSFPAPQAVCASAILRGKDSRSGSLTGSATSIHRRPDPRDKVFDGKPDTAPGTLSFLLLVLWLCIASTVCRPAPTTQSGSHALRSHSSPRCLCKPCSRSVGLPLIAFAARRRRRFAGQEIAASCRSLRAFPCHPDTAEYALFFLLLYPYQSRGSCPRGHIHQSCSPRLFIFVACPQNGDYWTAMSRALLPKVAEGRHQSREEVIEPAILRPSS